MFQERHRKTALWALALACLVYSAVITYSNVQHVRSMPDATRMPLTSLSSLPKQVVITESGSEQASTGALTRRDVFVQIGRESFPESENVWVNTTLSAVEPGRYLERFRMGWLIYDERANGTKPTQMYLVEVHQDFATSGDKPRANFWLFPVTETQSGEFSLSTNDPVTFAHNVLLDDALIDPQWRAVFAENYARLVRAVPALAAFLVACAALGSLLFKVWRTQPWAVVATTVTFVLPIVSAAPFLTAFGWMPIIAAVLLGYILTVAITCAVEQRFVPVLRAKLSSGSVQRILEALLVPAVALLAGTALVISFASVSVIEWQGLGSASPGELFMESLVRPAIGLLAGGFGSCLILAVFYWLLSLRIRSRTGLS